MSGKEKIQSSSKNLPLPMAWRKTMLVFPIQTKIYFYTYIIVSGASQKPSDSRHSIFHQSDRNPDLPFITSTW